MLKDRRRPLIYLLLFILILTIYSVTVYAYEIDEIVQVTRVIDGDSFEVSGDEVRLADVSAPEWNMPGGTEATNALFNLISGEIVYLDTDQKSGRGPYGRLIAVVYIIHNSTHYKNVNEALLQIRVVSETDYTNNEFSPSTWKLFERYAPSPPPISTVPVTQTVPLEGNLTFTFYPDDSIKVKVIGSLEQAIEPYSIPPVYEASLNLASSPSGVNLTDVTGTFVLKLNPMYSMLLAALELDIEAHGEGLSSNTTILFNMPGYLGVNGTTGAFTDESTGENNLDFDLTITIWYSLLPKEEIQGFIQMFPTLEAQIVTQINELMEGNVTLQDLTYSGETGFASATITITGSLVGDFVKGGTALSTNLLPLLGIYPETTSLISPEDLMYTKAKSADMHIWYDRNEFAFLMDSESVIEGDLDRQVNIMKDIYLEQLLQLPDTPPEWALIINDVLLPTDISRENLGMTLEYLFDGEKIKLNFVIEGLVFKPPTTGAFLTILDKALTGGSAPGFSLVFEGGSDEEGFVEIEVPLTTSDPVIEEPRKVVWIIDDLANLNLVSFTVKSHLKPAELEFSNLRIFYPGVIPPEVESDETVTVTVSIDVTNVGEEIGGCTLELKVDGEVVDSVDIAAFGGIPPNYDQVTATQIFELTRGEGTYQVEVEGLTETFTVSVKPVKTFWTQPVYVAGILVIIASTGAYLIWRRKSRPTISSNPM